MTIQGALTDLRNLLNADDIPCYYKPSIKKIIETIEQEPKTGWIPVSERLPQDGRYICDYGDCIDFGLITNGEWYVDGVIAWQPLPKPYKEK